MDRYNGKSWSKKRNTTIMTKINIKDNLRVATNVAKSNMNAGVYAKALSMIDLTSLNTTDTISKIVKMTNKVNRFKAEFPGRPQVAAICVFPNFASVVKEHLKDTEVKIAVVAGVFPSSQSFTSIKVAECEMAAAQGADEVDIVLSLGKFLEGDLDGAGKEIARIKGAIGDSHLKVILESGSIGDEQMIYNASMLAMEHGADFIKTSTGKTEPAATPEAAIAMCTAIADFHKKSGKKVGFKPAGGIVSPEDAVLYYSIVQTILGDQWLNSMLFRIGASRLANNLLSKLEEHDVNYF
ncbi:MAG: deoxyribose-phosphate aldolase [Bacteroidia bacterium]|nr:deoxyribose-phosphate aldolase [Bacteroidia bacterium]